MDVNQDPHLPALLPLRCKHLLVFQLAPPISFPIESLFTTDSPQCQGSDETRSPFRSAAHADAFSFSSCSSVFLACLSFRRADTTPPRKKKDHLTSYRFFISNLPACILFGLWLGRSSFAAGEISTDCHRYKSVAPIASLFVRSTIQWRNVVPFNEKKKEITLLRQVASSALLFHNGRKTLMMMKAQKR